MPVNIPLLIMSQSSSSATSRPAPASQAKRPECPFPKDLSDLEHALNEDMPRTPLSSYLRYTDVYAHFYKYDGLKCNSGRYFADTYRPDTRLPDEFDRIKLGAVTVLVPEEVATLDCFLLHPSDVAAALRGLGPSNYVLAGWIGQEKTFHDVGAFVLQGRTRSGSELRLIDRWAADDLYVELGLRRQTRIQASYRTLPLPVDTSSDSLYGVSLQELAYFLARPRVFFARGPNKRVHGVWIRPILGEDSFDGHTYHVYGTLKETVVATFDIEVWNSAPGFREHVSLVLANYAGTPGLRARANRYDLSLRHSPSEHLIEPLLRRGLDVWRRANYESGAISRLRAIAQGFPEDGPSIARLIGLSLGYELRPDKLVHNEVFRKHPRRKARIVQSAKTRAEKDAQFSAAMKAAAESMQAKAKPTAQGRRRVQWAKS